MSNNSQYNVKLEQHHKYETYITAHFDKGKVFVTKKTMIENTKKIKLTLYSFIFHNTFFPDDKNGPKSLWSEF